MHKLTFKETLRLIKSDLPGYCEPLWKAALFIPGFKYTLHHRLCFYFSQYLWGRPLFVLWWLYTKHLTYLYGIQTAWNKSLPESCVIAHFGGITFFPESCGRNVYLRQGVTVGGANRLASGQTQRHPRIGNNVVFGANSIVIGDIEIADGTIIAAGAVVTKSTPQNSVVAGVPARVVKIRE